MSDDLSELQLMSNWRVIAYGLATAVIILAGAIFAAVVGPSPMQECGRQCGNRTWSWTEGTRSDNVYRPPRCECQAR